MAAPVLQFKRGLLANLPGLRAGEPGFTTDSYDLYVGIDSTTTNNKFFGSHRYWTRGTASTGSGVNLVEGTTNGTDYITLKAPDSLAGITTYTFPATATAGYYLKTAADGTLSWAAIAQNSFSGIVTFTDTTDNTLGNADTGSVQIDGGLGINKNLTVGQNLSVQGYSEFVGVVTFRGGTINIGDAATDNINVSGEFISNLTPNADNTYDLGIGTQRWRDANFAGVVTAVSANITNLVPTNINSSGIATLTTLNATNSRPTNLNVSGIATITNATGTNLNFTGVSTATTLNSTVATLTNASGTNLNFTGISTLTNLNTTNLNPTNINVSGAATVTGALTANGNVTLGDAAGDTITVNGTATFGQSITGTISTATRATTVDTTTTSSNTSYYVPFVSNITGTNGETLRVGAGISINPSTGNVGVSSILSVGSVGAINSYIRAGGGSNAMYLYSNGDVSFQAKVISNSYRSQSNSSNTLSFSDLDATFARDLKIVGVATAAQLTIGTGVAATQFSSAVGSGTSTSSVPTSSAVIDYVGTQIGNVDLTLGLNADSGGPSTVNTSQTLTISGTTNQVQTAVSGQTVTVSLPATVVVGTSLSAPTVKAATLQHSNGTQAATIDTSGNITASQNLTISGNLYVNGSTTQVNTTTTTIEDQLLDLGMVDGSAPSSDLNKDIGLLLNYYTTSAKKAAVFWDDSASRIVFADDVTESTGVLTVAANAYASIEIEGLWVNDCAGQSQVINCSGTTRTLENITIDGGSF